MKIGGIQKLSLIDYPGKVSAIVFTVGCSFRCGYCHNPELVLPRLYKSQVQEGDAIRFLESRRKVLDGVVITGGEPAIQSDLLDFMMKLKSMGYLVKLDTSGILPNVVRAAIDSKLVDYIAMDIKAPLDRYKDIVNAGVDIESIRRSIGIIKGSGIGYEFRTTVVREELSIDDILEISKEISGARLYALQRFRPGHTLDPDFSSKSNYSEEELEGIRAAVERHVVSCTIR